MEPPPFFDDSHGSKKRKRNKGAGKGNPWAATAPKGEGGKKASKGTSWADWVAEKNPDGRFRRMEDGSEICFDWGRNPDGCATPCKQVPKRAHACELCRGSHRTINCPTFPGWKPPKGKGKGKGKHLLRAGWSLPRGPRTPRA